MEDVDLTSEHAERSCRRLGVADGHRRLRDGALVARLPGAVPYRRRQDRPELRARIDRDPVKSAIVSAVVALARTIGPPPWPRVWRHRRSCTRSPAWAVPRRRGTTSPGPSRRQHSARCSRPAPRWTCATGVEPDRVRGSGLTLRERPACGCVRRVSDTCGVAEVAGVERASVSSGRTSCQSPTMPRSQCAYTGASWSVLTTAPWRRPVHPPCG